MEHLSLKDLLNLPSEEREVKLAQYKLSLRALSSRHTRAIPNWVHNNRVRFLEIEMLSKENPSTNKENLI